MSHAASDSSLFGFDSDAWLERLRRNEHGGPLGTLGPYELIAEAGRGGQGVVYRARQPGTGRVIAVKRLLAGVLASPESLRRFEREIEAASALSHPGIVAVYGVDFAAGTPLLAMEWVEGVPVTRWASDRARDEVLDCFLSVCDAVQHAHQCGVLHRDVKPSNVLVDAAGRARLLDFGLARSFQVDSSITSSGVFLGTPAYAAPEQLEGRALDVRADVYSLGAILFEVLTGRRLIEGEGVDALVRARALVPPRPSSLVRTIPRDLDAIVLRALATEREERYQSVDAFAADLRRFRAGSAVLAQAPSAWYLLRKLVARNRLATALVAALLLGALTAGVAYALLSARHAGRLTEERDKALAAGQAADEARQEADGQRRLAEDARDAAQKEELRARAEQENTEDVLAFFLEDVLVGANPVLHGPAPSLLELLQSAAPKIHDRFGDAPFVEARVRGMLGDTLHALGDHAGAERELRAALAVRLEDPGATPCDIADLERSLGSCLVALGRYEEAEAVLLAAEARPLGDDPRAANLLYEVYAGLTLLYNATLRYDRIDRTTARQLELADDERKRLVTLGSRAAMTLALGQTREAQTEFESLLPQAIAALGENSADVSMLRFNLAVCHERLGNMAEAEAEMRRTLEIQTGAFGPEHSQVALTSIKLAQILLRARRPPTEAEAFARRGVAILRASSSEGVELAMGLEALACALRLDDAAALPYMEEALELFEKHVGRGSRNWAECATDLVVILAHTGHLDEAQQLLDDLATHPFPPSRGLALRYRAGIATLRGDLWEAAELYDQAIHLLAADPVDSDALPFALTDFARVLRDMGDEAGALELERQLAELSK